MKRTLSIIGLLGLAACSREFPSASSAAASSPSPTVTAVPSEGAADTSLIVAVTPPDLTTAVGDALPSVNLFAPGGTNQALLDALAPYVSLVTWPEQTVVDTEQVALAAADEHTPSSIQLRPKTPLSDRWYAVRVTGLPPTLAFPRFAASKLLGDGVMVWRFKTGSGPIISSLELCAKDGRQTGSVTFSERIAPGSDPGALIAFDRSDCHYLPRPVVGVPDKASDQTTKIVQFACDTVGDVTVTWKSGATAASVSTIPVPAATYSLAGSAMEDVGDSCRRLMGDI